MDDALAVLQFSHLVKEYDNGVRALDGLSFTIPAGAIFGFIGLNGAGKTTTIKIVAGLSRRTSGEVRLFGKPIEDHDEGYKRDIGFVLDEPLYFDWMTPKEYLLFVATMYAIPAGERGSRIAELLEFFDLQEKCDSPIATLSTGMKKKISLAAAIVHGPRLILLDEPLEGIDAVAASSIKETLSMMASRGTTILITSHVLDTVERFCSDVAIIHQGKILLECKTSEIRTRALGAIADRRYESLEELFVDLVSDKVRKKNLTWL